MGCSPLFYGYVSDPQSSSRVISKENFLVSGSLKKSPLCVDPLQKKKSLPLWKISLCLDLSAKEKNIFSPPLCPFLCPQEKIPLCSDLSLLIYMTTHIYMEYSVSFFNARGYMESAYMWLTLDTLSKMQPASRIRDSRLTLPQESKNGLIDVYQYSNESANVLKSTQEAFDLFGDHFF